MFPKYMAVIGHIGYLGRGQLSFKSPVLIRQKINFG